MPDDLFGVPASSSLESDRRPATTRSRRIVRMALDQRRYRRLERLAAEVDATVDQLAAVWLRDRIDQMAATSELMRVADELGEVRAGLVRLAAARSRPRERARTGHTEHGALPGRRGSLHGEIVTVLEQRGEPMTAAEIADAIRQRDAYRAPRSGHPITGAAVSRRIANPYYRSLFERRGRQVGLAQDEQR